MSHLKDRYLSTYTGKKFYPYDAAARADLHRGYRARAFDALPIRWECRFFFSVAEHSIAVAHPLPANLKLFRLLHDASEAYLADLPRR
jgi:hypothetical protein